MVEQANKHCADLIAEFHLTEKPRSGASLGM